MKNVSTYVARYRGSYTVKALGQPNDHIMNWRGCNYRAAMIPGMPRRMTLEEARAMEKAINDQALQKLMRNVSGSSMGDVLFAKQSVEVWENS